MLAKPMNIIKNSLKRKNLPVMMGKLLVRMQESNQNADSQAAISWCQEQAEPYDVFLKSLDALLWDETEAACQIIEKNALEKLKSIEIDLGGGGNYFLLYFFTRFLRAQTVVETGVAAGWSSQSILTALASNNNDGKLYSSDFPYFRHENPEELVGYVVDDALKQNWTLLIDGDQNNLPQIEQSVNTVDLFHYDSDKSYKGRTFAADLIIPKCHENSIIIFDDIQDNMHFKDYVEGKGVTYKVFEFNGKYVGLIAPSILDQK